eukprot:7389446-Prymnesium_polylepis.2
MRSKLPAVSCGQHVVGSMSWAACRGHHAVWVLCCGQHVVGSESRAVTRRQRSVGNAGGQCAREARQGLKVEDSRPWAHVQQLMASKKWVASGWRYVV